MKENLSVLTTEQYNERSQNIDQLSTKEIITLMNEEDKKVGEAVERVLPQIEAAVETVYQSIRNGGRLFYVGAGTSGRIGVLDASECPPTFCTPPEMVQALIAGGETAIVSAVEGAEDNFDRGAEDLRIRQISSDDVIIGIAASGRTPYVKGALHYAGKQQAATIALSCNLNAEISNYAKQKIEVVVGPEILTGSTRLKSATAQKMIVNMITTTTMIKLGKVYGNLMVDLNASNLKLLERARNIVMKSTGVPYEEAVDVLNATNQRVKTAIVMLQAKISLEDANKYLDQAGGFIHKALKIAKEGNVV
ncbi:MULTISPECIES: N-acetylmuramic acid 6-phosphate etherase [unclassified Bacillus (in: firmicutes)]|uniref:N-acetylmuramic acid 6-phosphate etherase n=1 Tax=unclassified Bacillus (in: firmicutes) TaxID=185979 RepID=UPI0004E20452|nr:MULTISPECIES: N-acetylmuramic acid 6-phosphate etherase [unclassified Bacillus (in: firmicutes)]